MEREFYYIAFYKGPAQNGVVLLGNHTDSKLTKSVSKSVFVDLCTLYNMLLDVEDVDSAPETPPESAPPYDDEMGGPSI